jgi:hypothetical protein
LISSAFNLRDFSPFLTVAILGALIICVTALGVVLEGFGASRRRWREATPSFGRATFART